MEAQLKWMGHLVRMEDYRLPKIVAYGELEAGKRPRGRPKLRFKDAFKQTLKSCYIDADILETLAQDRRTWKTTWKDGVKRVAVKRCRKAKGNSSGSTGAKA